MLSALGFLTVLGGARPPDARSLRWFPVVGAAVGGVLALVLIGARELWPMAVVAALVVAADLVLTGMLHVDGLADSADGLLPHLDRDRRLAVMRAPDVGAFALAVVGVWAASRTVMATVPGLVPYARSGGLASSFLTGASPWTALWVVPCTALVVLAQGALGAAALGAGLAGAGLVVATARRRLGGFTGDVLGAAGVIAETTALVVLSAR